MNDIVDKLADPTITSERRNSFLKMLNEIRNRNVESKEQLEKDKNEGKNVDAALSVADAIDAKAKTAAAQGRLM